MADLAEHLARLAPSASRQTTSLENIFEEEPVPLDIFVRDRKFLGNPDLGSYQFDAVRHIERVYLPDLYPLMAQEFDPYWGAPIPMKNVFTLEWGKGGGKDHSVRISTLRVIYLILCLKDPHAYFNFPWQDSFHILNVAANRDLARRAFFEPMTRVVKTGWFADRAEPLKNSIVFDKGIEAISGHSDGDTQDGLNLLLSIADEVDAFHEPDPRRSASGDRPVARSAFDMIKMMRSSGASRFPRTFKHVRISYPRYLGSPIERLRIQGEESIAERGERSVHYIQGPLATWEVNPKYKDHNFIEVPGAPGPIPEDEEFIDAFKEDPDSACGKYFCQPKRSTDAYFRNEYAIDCCFTDGTQQPVEVDYRLVNNAWTPEFTFDPRLKPIRGAMYAMHFDLAKTADRAGAAMAHVVSYGEYEKVATGEKNEPITITEARPIVNVDFVFSFESDLRADPAREIQVWWARDLVSQLRRRGFVIIRVTYDGYESLDSRQMLETWGIETDRLSTDTNPGVYRNARDVMYEGRLTTPHRTILRDEILALRKLPNGKIDHPPNGSKDESDAFAGAIFGAIEVGGQEDPDGEVSTFSQSSMEIGEQLSPVDVQLDDLGWDSPTPTTFNYGW